MKFMKSQAERCKLTRKGCKKNYRKQFSNVGCARYLKLSYMSGNQNSLFSEEACNTGLPSPSKTTGYLLRMAQPLKLNQLQNSLLLLD